MADDELVPEYVDEEDPTVRSGGPWRIETVTHLDWAMSRLAALQLELADLADQERVRVEAIEQRAAFLAEKVNGGVSFFEAKIAEYAHSHRGTLLGGGKKKSREVLHGVVGWRDSPGPGKLVVTDAEALDAWLQTKSPDSGLYRVKLEPEMDALKALHEAEKVVPPGCEWVPKSETFFVRAAPLMTDIVLKGE